MNVVILSGGIDSTTLAYWLKKVRYRDECLECLTFNYGQKHVRELASAKEISFLLNADWHLVDLSQSVGQLIRKGALTGDDAIPEEYYSHESQKVTVVPNRNSIMLAIAVGRAVTIGAERVFYAAHFSDAAIYPDCRGPFVKAFRDAEMLATDDEVIVEAPFIGMTKTQVVAEGLKIDVPYYKTWSCYKGDVRPCLKCGTCLERQEAFLNNGVIDPLLTEDEWYRALELLRVKKPVQEVAQ